MRGVGVSSCQLEDAEAYFNSGFCLEKGVETKLIRIWFWRFGPRPAGQH
jgi:hypothetical protein